MKRGPKCKLSEEQILKAISLRYEKKSVKEIAERFNVSFSVIRNIFRNNEVVIRTYKKESPLKDMQDNGEPMWWQHLDRALTATTPALIEGE